MKLKAALAREVAKKLIPNKMKGRNLVGKLGIAQTKINPRVKDTPVIIPNVKDTLNLKLNHRRLRFPLRIRKRKTEINGGVRQTIKFNMI